jgi:hypothetical protein
MECLALLAIVVLACLWPLLQMLFGKGPNSLRRLIRPDLAAFFVLTAGIAFAMALVRTESSGTALCLLAFVLPFALALAWLGRVFVEEIASGFSRKSSRKAWETDLSFLSEPDVSAEPLDAAIVEEDLTQSGPQGGSQSP